MPSLPKPASQRQRRNRPSSASTLRAGPDDGRPQRAPTLDKGHDWHSETRRWWRDIWHSPMAPEYLKTDGHGLTRLALLVDDFWRADTASIRMKLSAEIRHLGALFGLTPIDRRRLQWEVERVESTVRKRPPPALQVGEDPRERLRAVK